ncbi:hypothetical protein ABT112_15585 [Streptomyces sp. NPDC002055]|uniref:hypothetical protein n=1 Tax=Streptomyces sp. NPDC002055 TaxID=3154534 RepID=UPI003327EF92
MPTGFMISDLARLGAESDLADGLGVTPEALGLTDRDDAASWLDRQPLIVALTRRARDEPARPEFCYCGYPVAPDWHHEHCYPGIIVD